ncbi:MAG: phosphotransferase [Chloroflexota bacterium]|nr:phosphotransferase [Chloroflexota bacterium]
MRGAIWPDFLHRKTEQALRAAWSHLTADAGTAPVQAVANFLEREVALVADVPLAKLVHGDYFAENVFVEQAGAGWRVSGVIDFSDLTLPGDPRLDLTSAVLFLEELPD